MMLIGYKMMHKEMMGMVTTEVKVLLEVMVVVVCLEEAKLFATTIIRQAI